ncbi:Hpt domain-containing protein [Pseudomonas sp. LRF_L74]|uniref:Hpt domain-containing protein n=1 Tax=Pseudomonas sp. LRF_L74 TaxID=3369422 RepID=UPI003F62ED07
MSDFHLDNTVLSALQEVMEDEYPTLIETFLADSEERMVSLHKAVERADAQLLQLAAHSFKGSSSNMGAPLLASLCRQLEDDARRGQLCSASRLIARIGEEFSVVRALLRDGLQGNS